ncbi:MAG: MBL fold metallo-hydrolase [Bdellovibrionota bacterium]
MIVKEFFDPTTFTLTYVVHKKGAAEAIVIDPVLDYDPASGAIDEHSINLVVEYLRQENLSPAMSLETHAHADHVSASQVLKKYFPEMKVAISSRIVEVQKIFFKAFNLDEPSDGSQFDYLFADNEEVIIAGMKVLEIPTPGHTPACSAYLIEDAVFTGDALFMPDYGVGRCDFPGGDARKLYHSITKNIYSLKSDTRIFVGHDYQPNGRPLKFVTTVGEEKESNIQLDARVSEGEFVEKREARDKTLSAPKLLLPSIQINIMAGHLPEPEANGVRI